MQRSKKLFRCNGVIIPQVIKQRTLGATSFAVQQACGANCKETFRSRKARDSHMRAKHPFKWHKLFRPWYLRPVKVAVDIEMNVAVPSRSTTQRYVNKTKKTR